MIWKKRKTKVYLLLILIIMIGSLTGWYYIKQSAEDAKEEEISNYQYQVEDPQLISYSNGHKRWDIKSETITQPKTDDDEKVKVILKKIKDGKLYSNQGLEYEVKADKIVYFEKSKNIDLFGNVRLEEAVGDKIFADRLSWNDKTKHLKTNSGVRVEMEDGQLTAQKMDMDLEKKVIDFTGDVTMTFKVRGAQGDEK